MVATGDLLSGRYEIQERLGQGGMAVVFRALDQQLGRSVAVKVLHQQFAEDPETVERFQREARAAAALSHSNIVEVYDVGRDQDSLFIVMAFVEGEDLGAILQRDGRRAPEEAARIGAQVADALAYAHRRGVIHRDVKPQNILIDTDHRARLSDFGIAEVIGSSGLTQSGWVMGTAYYLSPERAQGEPGGPESDIYALGVVLYEMLAGRRPFSGSSPVAIALQQLQNAPPPLESVAPDSPATLLEVVRRAMAYDPVERYRNASDLADDLRAAGQGGAITAPVRAQAVSVPTERMVPAPAPRGRGVPPPRRTVGPSALRGFLTAVAALLLTLGVLAGGAWLLGQYGGALLRQFAPAPVTPAPVATGSPTRVPITATAPPHTPTAVTPTAVPPTATAVPPTRTPAPPTATAAPPPALLEVPNLVGRSRSDAEEALRRAQLAVAIRDGSDPARPVGAVIGQSPAPGSRAEPGTVVTLTVNRPPASPAARVPNVEGMDEREARRTLEQAQFKVQVQEVQARQGESKGSVVNQLPDAGATVEIGSTVRIDIGT